MGKKRPVQSNKNKKDYVSNIVAAAKEQKEKNEAAKAEEAKQVAMEKMTAEEKLLFMSQEEILEKEKELAKREEELAKQKEAFENTRLENEESHKKAEERIKNEQEALETKKNEHREKEQQLAEREKSIISEEKKLSDEKKAIDKKKSDLNNQERDILERENNAEAGFSTQNERSIEALRKRQEELELAYLALQEKKANAEKELEAELLKVRAAKLEQLEKELEAYKIGVKAEIATEVKLLKDSANESIAEEKALLESAKKAFENERKEVNAIKNAQEKTQRKLNDDLDDLAAREAIFEEDQAEFESRVDGEVERRVSSTIFELEQVRQDLESNKERLYAAQQQIAEYKKRERAADGASAEELLQRVAFLEEEKNRLERELAEIPRDEQLAAYQSKAASYDGLLKEKRELEIENQALKREQEKMTQFEVMLADAREEAVHYKKMVEVRQLMLQKYSEEVDKFRSLYQQPKELESRLDAIFENVFEIENYADATDLVEIEWLENIYTNCENSGVVFNKRLLKSFHTALKTSDWSPLTVLAGVSGTGKSLLPEYYCKFGGIYFKSMAVQPDWDSPQSLFGFFNSIDNRFNATTLIRAMVQFVNFKSLQESVKKILKEARSEDEVVAYLRKLAVEEYNLNDAMFMVLLDEMNLAHVELYFSDMLSKLERRRNSDELVSVEIDMGAGMSKFPLELSNNILWVGTMNEDETTKSLSDKVLDRGNLISFPRPTEFRSRKKITYLPAAPMLKRSVWNEWVDANVIENVEFSKMVEKYRESLQRVNGFLGHAGRALGHRVWQSIENYMANHPDVIEAFTAETFDVALCESKMMRAFEEALVHKVMPKLRGIETDGNLSETCIKPIQEELFGKNGLAKGLEKDFNNAVNNPYETFLWCSAEYLNEEE